MGRLPCDGHGGPSRDRLLGAYPALVSDGQRKSKYLRLCTQCMFEMVSRHRKDWDVGFGLGAEEKEPTCTSCGAVFPTWSSLSHFYCTAYVRRDQRVDYFAFYCPDCSDIIQNEFRLEAANGRQH